MHVGATLDLAIDGAIPRARAAGRLVRFLPTGGQTVLAPMFGERAAVPLRVAGTAWGALVAAAPAARRSAWRPTGSCTGSRR